MRNFQRASASLLPASVLRGIMDNLVTVFDFVDITIDFKSSFPGTLIKILHRKKITAINIGDTATTESWHHAASTLLVPVSKWLDVAAYK